MSRLMIKNTQVIIMMPNSMTTITISIEGSHNNTGNIVRNITSSRNQTTGSMTSSNQEIINRMIKVFSISKASLCFRSTMIVIQLKAISPKKM
jgi:hypothetical protein